MAETKKTVEGATKTLEKESGVVPTHIGIIMDGNRRWADDRGWEAVFGHKEGYKRVIEISDFCKKVGVKILTIYALSSENLKERSKKELDGLFSLIKLGIKREAKRVIRENIRLNFIGRKEGLPADVIREMEAIQEKTKNNTAGVFNIALNYGGRDEIVDAVKKIMSKKIDTDELTEQTIAENLYTEGQEDPDIIVRTGGRVRMSNFLLWQGTYAECYFTNVLWPDFGTEEMKKALDYYSKTQRNFGA